MTKENKCIDIILVGFCSRMAASIVGPVFIKKFKEEYPITKVINFFTRTAYLQQYGLNFDTVLGKHDKVYKKYLLAESEGRGLKAFSDFQTPVDHFTFYNEVIQYSEIVEKIIETINEEKPFQILFNNGGGNSHHQQMLTDCYWRLKEEYPQGVFNVYLDYHTGLNFYEKNISGSTIETSVTLYPYDAEISMEDLVSLDKKKLDASKGETIYPLKVSKKAYSSLSEDYWNKFITDYKNKDKAYNKDSFWDIFYKPKKGSEIIKLNLGKQQSTFIENLLKELTTIKSNIRKNKSYSYKGFLHHIFLTLVTKKVKSVDILGNQLEEAILGDIEKLISNQPKLHVTQIDKNREIVSLNSKRKQKEFDIILLKKNMSLKYYEIKGRYIEMVEKESFFQQIQKDSSEYTNIDYVIPFDPGVQRCLADDFYGFVKRFAEHGTRFFVYAPSNSSEKKWIVERNEDEIQIVDEPQGNDYIVVRNFIPHFKREVGLL